MKKGLVMFLIFLCTLAAASAQQITFPQDGITYGPWSETYFDYPRTGGMAHHIRVQVELPENTAYQRIMHNGEWIEHLNGEEKPDFGPLDSVMDFAADDLEPMDLVGHLSAVQELTLVAYDEQGNELGRDQIQFFLAVNLEDYFELIEADPEFASTFAVSDNDLNAVQVSREKYEDTSLFFDIKKFVTYVTARNRFTNEVEEHTRIKLVLEPKTEEALGEAVDVYTVLPKHVVEHLNQMTLEGEYEVLDVDPVMMWHFGAVTEDVSIEYDVQGHLEEGALEEVSAIAIADVEPRKTPWYFLLPLVLPMILLFAMLYLSRFKRHVK